MIHGMLWLYFKKEKHFSMPNRENQAPQFLLKKNVFCGTFILLIMLLYYAHFPSTVGFSRSYISVDLAQNPTEHFWSVPSSRETMLMKCG